MMRLLILTLCVIALFPLAVNASEGTAVKDIDYSPLKKIKSAKVNAVINPLTIQLDDADIVALSSLWIPDYSIETVGPIASLAQEVLADMLIGETVNLYQVRHKYDGLKNRMGHLVAHIERNEDKLWVQGVLIDLGLAITRTNPFNRDLADAMYAAEIQARTEKRGLWANKGFAIISPDDASAYKRSVRIIEGRVRSLAAVKNTTYINFGENWRDDFTIAIPPEAKRLFSKSGIDPQQWSGNILRVRGWIDEYNGPYIEATHPEMIELLKD